MRPLCPGSTLFPYTTLFRSPIVECLLGPVLEIGDDEILVAEQLRRFEAALPPDEDRVGRHVTRGRAQSLDRKSTRLNSSHRTISYAVFCLKKKNHQIASNNR